MIDDIKGEVKGAVLGGDLIRGARVHLMSTLHNVRISELAGGINGEKDDTAGITMMFVSPLK